MKPGKCIKAQIGLARAEDAKEVEQEVRDAVWWEVWEDVQRQAWQQIWVVPGAVLDQIEQRIADMEDEV